jgi:hypothetical protein
LTLHECVPKNKTPRGSVSPSRRKYSRRSLCTTQKRLRQPDHDKYAETEVAFFSNQPWYLPEVADCPRGLPPMPPPLAPPAAPGAALRPPDCMLLLTRIVWVRRGRCVVGECGGVFVAFHFTISLSINDARRVGTHVFRLLSCVRLVSCVLGSTGAPLLLTNASQTCVCCGCVVDELVDV